MANRIIQLDSNLGKELGFISERFDGWLWLDNERVLISMIVSREEGCGHLSALFKAIEGRGWRVAVPTPFPRMEAILKRKGFVPHFEETELGPCEVWEREKSCHAL
jgi:hypothetical protein